MRVAVWITCLVAAASLVHHADPKKVEKKEVKKAAPLSKKGDCGCTGKAGCDCDKKPVVATHAKKGDCDCVNGKKGDCDCINGKKPVVVAAAHVKKGDCDCVNGKKGDCDCINGKKAKVELKKPAVEHKKPEKKAFVAQKESPKVVVHKQTVKVEQVSKQAVEKAVKKAVAHLNKPVEHKQAAVVSKRVIEAPKEKKEVKKTKKPEMSEATKKLYEESKKKHKSLTPYGLKVEAPQKQNLVAHKVEKVEAKNAPGRPKEGAATIRVPEGQQEAMHPDFLNKEYVTDAKDHTKEKKTAKAFPHHDQSEAVKPGFYDGEYQKDGNAAMISVIGVVVAAALTF